MSSAVSPRGPPTKNRPIVYSCYCLLRKTAMHPCPHPQTCYHFLSHFPAGANKLWNLSPAFMNEVKWQKRRPRSTCDRTWAALSLTICLRLYLTHLAHTHSTHTPTNRMEVRLDLKLTQNLLVVLSLVSGRLTDIDRVECSKRFCVASKMWFVFRVC